MEKIVLTQSGREIQEDLDFTEKVVPFFSNESTYEVGDLVRHESKLYQCHTAVETAGAWTSVNNWVEINLNGVVATITEQTDTKIANVVEQLSVGDNVVFKESINSGYTILADKGYASYVRAVGNILYMVVSFNVIKNASATTNVIDVGEFKNIPDNIFEKLVADYYLDEQSTKAYENGSLNGVSANTVMIKGNDNNVKLQLDTTNLVVGTEYHIRHISTFLLTTNFYKSWGCSISNLPPDNNSVSISDVVFEKDPSFPTESQAWEEVEIDGNKFAKFYKMYQKATYDADGNLTGFIISRTKNDDSYKVYDCFLDANGNELPYILIGRYLISSSEEANSVEADPVSLSADDVEALVTAKGSGYCLMDITLYAFWRDLTLAIKQSFVVDTEYLGLKHLNKNNALYPAEGSWDKRSMWGFNYFNNSDAGSIRSVNGVRGFWKGSNAFLTANVGANPIRILRRLTETNNGTTAPALLQTTFFPSAEIIGGTPQGSYYGGAFRANSNAVSMTSGKFAYTVLGNGQFSMFAINTTSGTTATGQYRLCYRPISE